MALRTIRIQGDPVLEKVCKPIEKMTPKIQTLIEDMFDTMYESNGVGLAGPQVGILKRIAVIDTDGTPYVFINPKIVETDGEQTGEEGCLSLPGKSGVVTRPNYVKVEAWMKIWNHLHWKPRNFWQERYVMNWSIWMVFFIPHMWRVNCMTLIMEMMNWRMKYESSIYGNTGFCGGNT